MQGKCLNLRASLLLYSSYCMIEELVAQTSGVAEADARFSDSYYHLIQISCQVVKSLTSECV